MTGQDIALWTLSTACTALALWAIRISSTIHALRERVARLERADEGRGPGGPGAWPFR